MKRKLLVRFGIGLILSASMVISSSAGAAPKGSATPTNVQESLKTALKEAKTKLGNLEAWQSTLFDEEVINQPSRFVRDYRPGAGGMIVEVDTDGIRGFLELSGFTGKAAESGEGASMKGAVTKEAPTPVTPTGPGPKYFVALDTQKNCVKCEESMVPIKKLVRTRLERRGYTVVFLSAEEVSATQGSMSLLAERISELMKRPGSLGGMILQWREAPQDSSDSAHEGEINYLVRTVQQYTLPGETGVAKELRTERQMLLTANDPFVAFVERLFTESWIETGSKALAQRSDQQREKGSSELWVSVSGIPDFAGYQKTRASIQALLQSWGEIEDRKLAAGEAVFAIRTAKSAGDLAKVLAPLKVKGLSDRTVQLEWKP